MLSKNQSQIFWVGTILLIFYTIITFFLRESLTIPWFFCLSVIVLSFLIFLIIYGTADHVKNETAKKQEQQESKLQRLNEISLYFFSPEISIDEILELTVSVMSEIFNFNQAGVFLKERNSLVLKKFLGFKEADLLTNKISLNENSVCTKVFKSGIAQFIEDTREVDYHKRIVVSEEERSEICVPIQITSDLVEGVIVVSHLKPKGFSLTDFTLMRLLADQVGAALRFRSLLDQLNISGVQTQLLIDLFSHDLANLLQRIENWLEMRELDVNEVIHQITLANLDATGLVTKVRKYREVMRESNIQTRKVDLSQYLLSAILQIKADIPSLQIQYKIIPQLEILADHHLTELFYLILENSYVHRATDRDPFVELEIEFIDNKQVTISFRDNGRGIEPDRIQSLFDPKRRFGGLGLHICRLLVTKYNGTIIVDHTNQVDYSQGTNIRLSFHLTEDQALLSQKF
ncbi:MAG: ATP-binding protein [Candidatus Hodarchaeales archaeon]|jgi:signal transduction histidine kinase